MLVKLSRQMVFYVLSESTLLASEYFHGFTVEDIFQLELFLPAVRNHRVSRCS